MGKHHLPSGTTTVNLGMEVLFIKEVLGLDHRDVLTEYRGVYIVHGLE